MEAESKLACVGRRLRPAYKIQDFRDTRDLTEWATQTLLRAQDPPATYIDQMKTPPPMPSRDLGGVCTLNDPDDGTPIRKMFVLNDGLLLISEKCTYRLQVADQIDPDRKNPALPLNFQQ